MFVKNFKHPIPLKLKITLWYVVAMLLLSTFAFVAIRTVSEKLEYNAMTARIVTNVDTLARRLKSAGVNPLTLSDKTYYRDGVHMGIFDSEGNMVSGQIAFGISDGFGFRDGAPYITRYSGERYIEYDKLITLENGSTFWLKGIMSKNEEETAFSNMGNYNITLIAFMIIFASVGGFLMLDRSLNNVRKMTRTANDIMKSQDLSKRINIEDTGDEISNLANTIDLMLDEIERSFEREKQFTSDASHELRTPMAVILSECDYIQKCNPSPDAMIESAEVIGNEARRMDKLISELLMITRMDKNKLQVKREPVDFSSIVLECAAEQNKLCKKPITQKLEVAPNIIVNGDDTLLKRLATNIIANAYKYTDEGSINICLKSNKHKTVFSVSDTGIGISKEDLPHIWERFYRADKSRSVDETDSMGIGLSMVKWIAEALGGSVSVNSVQGKGSEFTFELTNQ